MDPLAIRRPRSTALAVAAVALAAWSLFGFAEDERLRSTAGQFARRFTLDRRRPLEIAAMRLEHSPDGALAVAVDAALEDGRGSGPTAEAEPELRVLWAESARSIGPELDGAGDLVLASVGRRPGSARHRFLLGQVAYASESRARGAGDPRQWIGAFALAEAAAPGLEPIYAQLGRAYLESWPRLSAEQRKGAAAAWHRAFVDPGFVAGAVLPAGALIGRDEAIALLPEQASPLKAAFAALARDGDVARAALLRPRLDRALRAERDAGIGSIAERLASGNLEGARSACQDWMLRCPIGEFDDPQGRAQTAHVLELWPDDTGGSWRTDPRGELVRYFLGRREGDVRGDALLRATDALTAVPDTVRARVHLLAGDLVGADEIRLKSAGSDAFEWVPYLVEAARRKLSAGDAAGARAVLKGLSPSAAEGCEVLLVRRDIAAALGDETETVTVGARLRWLRRDSMPAEAWSAAGSISLCLDEQGSGKRQIRIAIEAAGPVLVGYGWNGGREGSVLVPKGSSLLTVPLYPHAGRQILSVWSEAGGALSLGGSTISTGG